MLIVEITNTSGRPRRTSNNNVANHKEPQNCPAFRDLITRAACVIASATVQINSAFLPRKQKLSIDRRQWLWSPFDAFHVVYALLRATAPRTFGNVQRGIAEAAGAAALVVTLTATVSAQ